MTQKVKFVQAVWADSETDQVEMQGIKGILLGTQPADSFIQMMTNGEVTELRAVAVPSDKVDRSLFEKLINPNTSSFMEDFGLTEADAPDGHFIIPTDNRECELI